MEQIIKVQIKWGKEKFDYDMDINQTMEDFKAALYSMTFVPVDKQKVLFKGKTLKNDTNLSELQVKDKSIFMLMGAAEGMSIEEQSKPGQKTLFLEDLTPKQLAEVFKQQTGYTMPVGLINLGNTCYMNASIQCFKRINELKDYMLKTQIENKMTKEHQVTLAFSQLMRQMEQSGQALKPINFLQALFNAYPQFSEREGQGFKQQDADECYMGISQCLEEATPYTNLEGEKGSLMKDLFQIEYEVRMKNIEIPEEPETIKTEISKKLMCSIETQSQPTNHMMDGLKSALQEEVEKLSEIDNQNHIYHKISKIKKLPSYLAVQMSRFLWKGEVKEAQTQAGKVKILRSVSFPKVLDIYELCTPELQKSLDYGKEYEQKQREEKEKASKDKFDLWRKQMEESGKMLPDDSKIQWKMYQENHKEEQIKEHDENLYRPHGMGLDTGCYELVAVLTHQGRSSDSGHYISWIHRAGDDWLKYDDDNVTEVKTEQITDLRGGGDWHMGYYFFYRKLELQ